MSYKLLLSSTFIMLLTACGSDDNTIITQETSLPVTAPVVPAVMTYTGIFLDSAVAGLNYKTASQTGKTNELGEFNFQKNETITFSIGGIEMPSTLVRLYITPLSLYQTQDINQIEVVNLLRLLQSLDSDSDTNNGIEIAESVHQLASSLNIDFAASDFEQQASELISQSGVVNPVLISAEAAIVHFQETLNEISNNNLKVCTTEHEKVGHSGFFNTLAHNVSGKATIIDDCTIEINQFSYDGGGPDVYFYGAKEHQYDGIQAFPLGQQINGQTYNNASIIIQLPKNKSLDDLTGLSVWCVDFSANFGQMEFTP